MFKQTETCQPGRLAFIAFRKEYDLTAETARKDEELKMAKKKRTIYVTGPNRQDLSAVCCCLALADLERQINDRMHRDDDCGYDYQAVYPLKADDRILKLLSLCGAEAPRLMTDARTQTIDVDYSEGISVNEDISLLSAWKLMRKECRSTLAVTREDGTLEGVITTGDIARSYMEVFDNQILGQAGTPFKNIVQTLDGSLLTGDPDGRLTRGTTIVGAGNIDTIRQKIQPGDALLLGNRYETQLCAIEQQAAVMIVCAGTEVSRTILKIASEKGCVVITTPYDTYTAARMINQSIPVSQFMTRQPIHFQEDDYIDDIRPVMMNTRIRDFPILSADGLFIGMISRRHLIDMTRKQFILVGHNDEASSIPGIKEAEVVGIVDNHPLKTVETMRPVPVKTYPAASCAVIISRLFEENQIGLDEKNAGLLYAALLSDTDGLASPNTSREDRELASSLAWICGESAAGIENIMGMAGREDQGDE